MTKLLFFLSVDREENRQQPVLLQFLSCSSIFVYIMCGSVFRFVYIIALNSYTTNGIHSIRLTIFFHPFFVCVLNILANIHIQHLRRKGVCILSGSLALQLVIFFAFIFGFYRFVWNINFNWLPIFGVKPLLYRTQRIREKEKDREREKKTQYC